MSRAKTIVERCVAASEVPAYVGWTMNGVMASDGSLLWGRILSAEVQEIIPFPDGLRRSRLAITWERYVSAHRITVIDLQWVSLVTPMGPHMVTLSHSADVENAGDPHTGCGLCEGAK